VRTPWRLGRAAAAQPDARRGSGTPGRGRGLRAALASLAALGLAACGALPSRPTSTAHEPSAAFAAALQEALQGDMRGSAVLRRDPKDLLAALKGSLKDPVSVALEGDPYLSLASLLPRKLAVPVVEQAVERQGLAPYDYQLPHAFLLREIRSGPPWAAATALGMALQPRYVKGAEAGNDTAFWLQALGAAPAGIAGVVSWNFAGSAAFLQRVLADPRIAPPVKVAVLGSGSLGPGSVPVLESFVRGAPASALKEQALLDLAADGAPGSVQELAAFTDRQHAFPGVIWPATVMTAVRGADPHGYIAQGMAAVSRLTGTAYVDTARCSPQRPSCPLWIEGPAQYDPQDLSAWRSLLGRFARHPGSDDIAYTIGRIDEIDHRYGDAVLAFYEALSLPDGDMGYDAASRLLWVLDVEMDSEGIARLIPSAPEPLRAALRYALAVHQLREGRYGQAIAGLKAVRRHIPALAQALGRALYGWAAPTPFLEDFIPWQLSAAEQLRADAARAGGPEGAFRLARYAFQRPLLYYLGLWQGGRAGYIAFSSGGTIPSPAWMRYQAQSNNYAVAARLYARAEGMAGTGAALRAKDLYGEGESLVALSDYGAGTDLYPPAELDARAKSLLRAAAAADPHGGVGGDALMSLYYMTGDKGLLREVIRQHPGTSAAYDAKLREEPQHAYHVQAPPAHPAVDFQPLYTSNRLFAAERRAMGATPATSGVVVGRETLLVLAPGLPSGIEPAIESVQETAPGELLVQWGTYSPAAVPGLQSVYFPGRAYARVFAVFRRVRFQRVDTPPSFGW